MDVNKIKIFVKNQIKEDKNLIWVFLIFLLGLFLRTFRQDQLLGFYYDHGRDALMAADIISLKNFPAIGPTTGLSGIFLGPFWFYFIAPFYFLGNGNPAIAAMFVGLVDSLSIFLIYLLGKEFFNKKTGLISSFLWAISYYLVRSARWFASPSPVPFFTLLLLYGLGQWLINKKNQWLPVVFTCLAIVSQLEAASAIFYYPAILFMLLVFKVNLKKLLKQKYFWIGAGIFLLFLAPQVLFELKNNFLMSRNLFGFFTGEVNSDSGKSWAIPTISVIRDRVNYYYSTFFTKIDPHMIIAKFLAIGWLLSLLVLFFKSKNKKALSLSLIFLIVPSVALLFFIGNYGNLYDYYLTGFFPIFVILLSLVLSKVCWLILVPFIVFFVWQNGKLDYYYLIAGADGPTHISLGNQIQTIDWICQDHGTEEFNVDTYVPPVIPYSWDYLWQWYGAKNNCRPSEERTGLLYTVWETNPDRPMFLNAWLERQAGIGKIFKEVKFGGIGTERRERINE